MDFREYMHINGQLGILGKNQSRIHVHNVKKTNKYGDLVVDAIVLSSQRQLVKHKKEH